MDWGRWNSGEKVIQFVVGVHVRETREGYSTGTVEILFRLVLAGVIVCVRSLG